MNYSEQQLKDMVRSLLISTGDYPLLGRPIESHEKISNQEIKERLAAWVNDNCRKETFDKKKEE